MITQNVVKTHSVTKLFSLLSDIKQDNDLATDARNTLYVQYNAWLWTRIVDVCNETFAREIFSEVWIEIIENSISISKKLKKSSKSNEEEENLFLILIDEIIFRKKSQIYSDEKKYLRKHLLVSEIYTGEKKDDILEIIDECRGNNIDDKGKYAIETIEKNEDAPADAEHDFIETFLNEGKIKIEYLNGEELKAISKWLKIELGKLDKSKREILLEYFNIKGGRKKLDDEKIAYLCKRWSFTSGNLLKIRDRTFEKLEAAFLRYVEQEQERRKRNPVRAGIHRRA